MSGPEETRGTALFDLTGRVAIVTGAGRGLGRSIALALAEAGADIVAAARTASEVEAVAAAVRGLGRRAAAVVADVTQPAQCERMVDEACGRLGGIDILVNNAGINVRKPVLEVSPEEFRSVVETNLFGYFYAARAAGRVMVARGGGKVINISSIMGRVALPAQSAYASSKGGIDQLTRVMALEWATSGVQVNGVAPTYFETELTRPLFEDPERREFITGRTPMGRWGKPEELAGAVIFLASSASDYVTGETILVDGGWTAW
ncbi:MAG: SDR family NAD(P)-dependent oxidoreductase [Dehalococcoidia bacterium]